MENEHLVNAFYTYDCESVLCALLLKRFESKNLSKNMVEMVYNECERWYTSCWDYDPYINDIDVIYTNAEDVYHNDYFDINNIEALLSLFSEDDLAILFNLNRLFNSHDGTLKSYYSLTLDYIDVEFIVSYTNYWKRLKEVTLWWLDDVCLDLQWADFEEYFQQSKYTYRNHALKYYISEVDYETREVYFLEPDDLYPELSFTDIIWLEFD